MTPFMPESLPDQPPAGRFEQAFAALEAVVADLQAGRRGLDDLLALFEQGAALATECEAILDAAELRVERVLAADDLTADAISG